jgi:hypothetical protein
MWEVGGEATSRSRTKGIAMPQLSLNQSELHIVRQALEFKLLAVGSSLDKKEQERLTERREAIQRVIDKVSAT